MTLLAADNVAFTYNRVDSAVIGGWSAEFAGGEMTAITGPSGRGKSTLLYLLGLMLRPASGEIRVEGMATSRMSDAAKAGLRAELFGFVFQDAALDHTRTVRDNIIETSLYRGASRRASTIRAEQLLEEFGVELGAKRKPGQVSGGQAQRIALCRALLNDPQILLADEPTGNLDPVTTSVVVEALRRHAASGATVIVVTHSPEVAEACDRRIDL